MANLKSKYNGLAFVPGSVWGRLMAKELQAINKSYRAHRFDYSESCIHLAYVHLLGT